MARHYLAHLILVASFLLSANSSAILDFFSNTEPPQEDAKDAFVPEVYGGALTEFFETVSIVGEGEVNEEDIFVDHDEKIPEIDIPVEEFLLITDHELKARPLSDLLEEKMKLKQSNLSQKNLTTELGDSSIPSNISTPLSERSDTLLDLSTSIDPALSTLDHQISVPLDGDGAMEAPIGRSFSPVPEKMSNTESESDTTQFNQPLNFDVDYLSIDDWFSPPTESSNTVSSLSTSTPVNFRTESSMPESTVDDINTFTTSFDALLLELDKLEDLSDAVADLHTIEAQAETGDIDVEEDSGSVIVAQLDEAQDRTDAVDGNEEDEDIENFDFFAELYKWLG